MMRHKAKYIVLEAVLVLFMLFILFGCFTALKLENQNINTEKNFPDPHFRFIVEKFMGVEERGSFTIEEANAKRGQLKYNNQLSPDQKDNSFSHKGLHYFHSIDDLIIGAKNTFSKLDFTKFPNLRSVHIFNGMFESADFSNCLKLQTISLTNGSLKNINISKNKMLIDLDCRNNQLKSINIDNNWSLKQINCSQNQIKEISFKFQSYLISIDVMKNQISELEIPPNQELKYLYIAGNPISNIFLKYQENIELIVVDENQIFNTNFILHPSVKPKIEVIKIDGDFATKLNDLPEYKEKIHAQIDRILNQNTQTNIN